MRRYATKYLILSALLWPLAAGALSSDPQQPVHIQADQVRIDRTEGISIYEGRVEMRQGSLQIFADTIVLHSREDRLQRVVAEGKPVRFRQRPEGAANDIHGQADRVEYHTETATVELTGNGQIQQGNDQFQGDYIAYDVERSLIKAQGRKGGTGRVRAIIHPRGQAD